MRSKKVIPKKKMGLDTLAQLMVEGFEDVKNELRKEFHTTLNQEPKPIKEDIRAIRVGLGYINSRLDFLGERAQSNAGFAKEIDELRARVAALEKYIEKNHAKSGK